MLFPPRIELARQKVREFLARAAEFAQYAAEAPAGRVGRAGDVADAVRFLLHNTFTTGAVLKVDGGTRFTP